jgi:hypothetical protein
MKTLIRIAALTALLFSAYSAQPQAAIPVYANNLQDGGSAANGTIYFKPVTATGGPASYQKPGGGIATVTPVSATVTSGAFSTTLPNVQLTNPSGVCFVTTLVTNNGSVLGPGFSCVQPHSVPTGPTDWCQLVNGSPQCDLDDYVPVLTPAQTNYPSLPAPPDMTTMWNDIVAENIAAGYIAGQTTLTDSSTVTWNAAAPTLNAAVLPLYTPAGPSNNCGQSGRPSCTAQPDGISTRTINVTGMVAGARYLLVLNALGETAGAQTVNFGTGCNWEWTIGDVPMSGNTLVIPTWVNFSTLAVWTYDGTNCIGTVVD